MVLAADAVTRPPTRSRRAGLARRGAAAPPAPASRLRRLNPADVRPRADHVLYWMVAARRLTWNHALDRALEHARALERPLVVLEALRAGYPWASDRLHRFVLDGMADSARRLAGGPVAYYPYVEPEPGAGRGLLEALAARACVVVTDDSPAFFLPRMLAAAGRKLGALGVPLEAVDGCGLLPLAGADRVHATARGFRALLQRELPAHLGSPPAPDPLAAATGLRAAAGPPGPVLRRWPAASSALLGGDAAALARLPLDHAVPPVPGAPGGATAGARRLARFVADSLPRYAAEARDPDADATSGLSPYLHFGHVSSHQVLAEVADAEGWQGPAPPAGGAREGWWRMSASAEAFLDQLVTWRELCFNLAAGRPDASRYEALPDWARRTLEAHAPDPRPVLYAPRDLETAATGDTLWNAAQRQLLREGRIHNTLRMLWGKKILEWSPSPREALARLFALNDRWALDGRDPSSVGSITWILGRFDRPWGPERPIFGTVRYMSSASTARKVKVRKVLERHGA